MRQIQSCLRATFPTRGAGCVKTAGCSRSHEGSGCALERTPGSSTAAARPFACAQGRRRPARSFRDSKRNECYSCGRNKNGVRAGARRGLRGTARGYYIERMFSCQGRACPPVTQFEGQCFGGGRGIRRLVNRANEAGSVQCWFTWACGGGKVSALCIDKSTALSVAEYRR